MEDKRRLIRISMGREPDRPIRDVKAWLRAPPPKTSLELAKDYDLLVEHEMDLRN
jgi:hypothetical protein